MIGEHTLRIIVAIEMLILMTLLCIVLPRIIHKVESEKRNTLK